jgi:flagellar biosynthesis protein FlhF
MYVRKFEADSLEEALKDIKRELGPDAIILKTVTNKGLKGAFKKKKIEITAAISEKNYTKKAQVDRVLDSNQKESFYSNQSSYVANMIDSYSANREPRAENKTQGYGGIAINRTVNTVAPKANEATLEEAPQRKGGLDDFLSEPRQERRPVEREAAAVSPRPSPTETNAEMTFQLENYERRIEELERHLFDLTKSMERIERREPEGLYQLRNTLKSLDISEFYIQKMIKTATFELSREELEDSEVVFEFALRIMLEEVPIGMPLFSSKDNEEGGVITILLSEASSGQTSMIQKIAALKGECLIVQNSRPHESQESFADKVFDLKTIYGKGIAEIVSECRKAVESGKSVFIDYRCDQNETNETKKFIDGLRRAFPNVEVLITLSAIHSELYNRRVMNRYAKLSDGLVVSNLDLCLNFGALFNLGLLENRLPFKFYGTGETIPDDIEAATAERILAGLFQIT